MRVVLCNPPRSAYELEELAPPLGLLRLARLAHDAGCEVALEDLNLLLHLDCDLQRDFYAAAVNRLLSLEPDILGLTSMCVDSGVALELARRVKSAKPDVCIVLGGVHFSSIAQEIGSLYPWVDMVIQGEGEMAFTAILKSHCGTSILPILDRTGSGAVVPLYEAVRWEPYFHLNPRRVANIEAGRGCRFRCSFCYSPGFFPTWRTFSIDSVVQELARLRDFGVEHAWFVEDNFANDERYLFDVCDAIREARLGLSFSAYATFPQLTPPVIEAMASAGCSHIFSGIDAVGASSEKEFHKAFLRKEPSMTEKLDRLVNCGIRPTCAFLLSPPSHKAGADYDLTVRTALEAKEHGAQILLNCLTLYNKTSARCLGQNFEYDPTQAEWVMDCPNVCVNNDYAAAAPNLFPFHARFTSASEWRDFILTSHCLATLVAVYPDTMAELIRDPQTSPAELARLVLERTHGLMTAAKPDRRYLQADAAGELFSQTSGSTIARRTFLREHSSYSP